MQSFRKVAQGVASALSQVPEAPVESPKASSHFASVSTDIHKSLGGNPIIAGAERDAEWQRVNSAIADVLKDSSVLFSKLARLQGDFAGKERDELEDIGNEVRGVTDKLSKFSSEFYAGELNMRTSDTPFNYGGAPGGGAPGGGAPPPGGGAPGAPPPAPPPPAHTEEDFDVEAEISDEDSSLDKEFEGKSDED